jgi:hypothetical protein
MSFNFKQECSSSHNIFCIFKNELAYQKFSKDCVRVFYVPKIIILFTECFIDLGKLNLLKISLPWSKSVKLTVIPSSHAWPELRDVTVNRL